MNGNESGGNRDIVLAPGEYGYVLDTTKGLVNTIVGPSKISMSNTDQPVMWDKKRFVRVEAQKAIQLNAIAPEGFYIALYNPAVGDKHPQPGTQSTAAELQVGHRVNVHGPANFALFPGQMADVIRGHHMRSNQYLLAQVYNDAAATEHWKSAVVKPQGGTDADAPVVQPATFAPGQMLIIKGTDVAFFMPPTGIKVVPDAQERHVRDAVTLERLEYCILLDENGSKRFVQGPDVVFPEPTETFIEKVDNGHTSRKFRAIELNETSGLYVKVIADYQDEDGAEHKIGDELFITGKEQAIYFQREEHSIIRYGDQTKHYAVAVPSGEGRYVLDRINGAVGLRKGPTMLLCDPRKEVITRRILSQETVKLWYPNNTKVLEVNKALELESIEAATARTHEAAKGLNRPPSAGIRAAALYADTDSMNYAASTQVAGDTFSRGSSYTPPRTITIDTKYEGAVAVSVWTGYAVNVISKTGKRRIVKGPEHVLLEYDETLAPLELSTGKPKSDANLLRTVYLRVTNNKVSDEMVVESLDFVPVKLGLSYRINFEGDPNAWFEVENYIRLLTDHVRSLLRNAAKRTGIEDLYRNPVNLIRDTVLGKADAAGERPGLRFKENGMRVYDVEVLGVTIQNTDIATLLLNAEKTKLTEAVKTATQEDILALTTRNAVTEQALAKLKSTIAGVVQEEKRKELVASSETEIAQIAAQLAAFESRRDVFNAELAQTKAKDDARIELAKAETNVVKERAEADTAQIVARAAAVSPEVARSLTTLADNSLAERIATTLGPMAAMHGVSAVDVLKRLFDNTPLQAVVDAMATRTTVPIMAEQKQK